MKLRFNSFAAAALCVALSLPALAAPSQASAPRFHVLVFSKTEGFRHTSIPSAIDAIQQLGTRHEFTVEATEDASMFTDAKLAAFDALIFLNTSGDVLNPTQQAALQTYVENGGGWVGIHGAATTEYEWDWYANLVGAYFDDHPENQTATIQVADRVFPATSHLPDRWEWFDEWYNLRTNPRGSVHVLMTLDEATYEGGSMGHDHPIAWAHNVGQGRAFYTGLGHTEESYAEPMYLEHILGGIEWAAGAVDGDAGATIASSFRTVVLEDEVTDVMELDIAADGRVFWIERQGPLRVWDPETGQSHLAGTVPSWMVIEDGASGMALDPNFLENGWIYVYYTPRTGEPNRIARFDYEDGRLNMASEKVILEVEVQRDYCCHSAGYLYFDHEGNLWLSTGDNTHNIIEGGPPIDEIPGQEFSDAQRSSANTNDLRGKLIRIRPLPDGTYEIPEGNLFAGDDDPLTRPEIYTMGHRNPWRFTIDSETGWLYIGEVGLGNPPSDLGPWGWEEVNRAKEAGFFGWPYLAGPNEAYADYNAATGTIGPKFDPDHIVNDSPNNTGARELPSANPALIWYTYGQSEDFPALGAGGMSAAAGPVYHRPETAGAQALPDYYDGTFFLYEWMRNWIMEVRLDDEGELLQINPFLPGRMFSRPIDMKVGPDGALYVAEWGETFWGSNPDARIIRLDYYGSPQASDGLAAHPHAGPTTGGEIAASGSSASNGHATETARIADGPAFTWPVNGGFVDYDTPFSYRLDGAGDDAQVRVLAGHDTHAHLVGQAAGPQGTFQVARTAHAHKPDLHLSNRFIKLEAESGAVITLHPKRMEAEHTFNRTAERESLGGHPAGKGYAETVIIALSARDGQWAAYEPVNLVNIESMTLRMKPFAKLRVEVRLDSLGGPLLAETSVDSVALNAEAVVPEEKLEFNQIFDQAMDSFAEGYEPKADVYEGWVEVTLPVDDPGGEHALYVVFRGDESGELVQVDWIQFDGPGVNATTGDRE